MALTELSRYLPRNDQRLRFLRQGRRGLEQSGDLEAEPLDSPVALPPGGSHPPMGGGFTPT
jgi:putative (di)nucleoside polyphosphate hydrolase